MSEEFKASEPPTVGSTAPAFMLPARSGKMISLRDFAGQKDVLIYFYPKDDTPGCTRESCSLRDGWADLTKAGIEVLGISRDDAASHNAFAAKYGLPFELLTDSDHAIHEAYGAWGQNPNPAWGVGPLRKSFLVGKDGRIKHVFDKVDTERHAEQVLRAAGVAPAPKPAVTAAPAAPAPPPAAALAPKPPAPLVQKPAAPLVQRPAAPPAAPKAGTAAKKAAPKKKAAGKMKKAARKPKRAVAKKAVRKKAARKSAPKRKAAKKTKKSGPKRKAKKTAKRRKR